MSFSIKLIYSNRVMINDELIIQKLILYLRFFEKILNIIILIISDI